jgi:ribosome-binding factor A
VALASATGIIRSEVGRQLGLRHTPSLAFVADVLPDTAQRIEELVTQARNADAELARSREGAVPAGDADPYRKPAEPADDDPRDDDPRDDDPRDDGPRDDGPRDGLEDDRDDLDG